MEVRFRCDPALAGHIPPPAAARSTLPDWLRTMPATAYSDLHGLDVRTVKQCPPFIDAMAYGFVMPLACDVEVDGDSLTWDWDLPTPTIAGHPRSPISFHAPAQTVGSPFHATDQSIVKFNSFWTIDLDPGWSLFAMHPANRLDLPFRTISGLVDSDRFNDVGIFFPARWTDPSFRGVLRRGTPVVQCFPVPREPLKLSLAEMSTAEAARYDTTGRAILAKPGVYRKRFRARRGSAATK